MTGVLDGIEVLDLSWGIGGPMTGMLLADHGARVTKIEPPGGDPTRAFSGARVWHRGKRSAVLDLHDTTDRDRLVALATRADVLVESYSPGTTTELGIDFDTLHALNPRLVYCSITAYGDDGRHSSRPGYDALVAARTGHQWESRGVPGGTIARLAGVPPAFPDLVVPDDCWVGAPRPGPLFSGVPWVSVAACYLATLVISAALRVREQTGRGQHVSTSLMQGVLATTLCGLADASSTRRPRTSRAGSAIHVRPKGYSAARTAAGSTNGCHCPDFVTGAVGGRPPAAHREDDPPREATIGSAWTSTRCCCSTTTNPIMAAAFAKFPSEPWVALGAEVGVPVQPLRSPEEALLDPAFVADGCVIEVTDPEQGGVRQVGRVYELHACPTDTPAAPAVRRHPHRDGCSRGRHVLGGSAAPAAPAGPDAPTSPLAGIRVLDLGLAVAGPWGTMMLADLGADVIKVNPLHDGYWMSTHIAMCVQPRQAQHRDQPEGPRTAWRILRRLVETADVVQHNMRYDAAVRLGVDYEASEADQARPHLLPHARLREERRASCCPATTRPAPRSRAPTGSTAASTTTAPALAGHLARRHRQRLPLRDRHRAGALPPRPHRRGPVRRHVDHLRAAAQRVDRRGAHADGSATATVRRSTRCSSAGTRCYRLYEAVDGWLCVTASE